ncbi:glutamate racemase [Clostridium sp. AM58-1XD]|uniref:glutamate racemase n=1 Tax=Clostridium sp. AM58-1XD TaxID=2292307 RepID=UPI000E527681|nr:glutamate racemase [Clostridium sp. AM58-1XD]RGY96843.1 glutamate racemase [Clostridium sp. AM58-1XD]
MKIGIFDSGIGGLSVLHHAQKVIPDGQFIYYSDEMHVPYGEKSADQIRGYVKEIIHFLIRKDVDAIVIACNTATSVSTREFRSSFPVPIIGMEPAVKKAVETCSIPEKRIIAAATPVTIAGNKLHTLLDQVDQEHHVDLIPLPGLVRFAERGDFTSSAVDDYLKEAFRGYRLEEYSSFVLGCTHFNYFKERLLRLFPNPVHFIDGNEGTVRQLVRSLPSASGPALSLPAPPSAEYYFSGVPAGENQLERIRFYMEQLEKVYRL